MSWVSNLTSQSKSRASRLLHLGLRLAQLPDLLEQATETGIIGRLLRAFPW